MRIKSIFLAALTCLLTLSITAGAQAYDPFQKACPAGSSISTCQEAAKTTTNPIYHTLHTTANLIAMIAGIAAVFIIILAGLSLVTSSGNTETATKARKRITSALIGLVIIAASWSLVTFVIGKVIK